jgi:hypothetical protein
MRGQFAVASTLLISACTETNSADFDQQLLEAAISHSQSFAAIKAHSRGPAAMLDGTSGEHVTIAVGECNDDRFTRWATLRTNRAGSVERLVLLENGDEQWVDDRAN